MSKTKFCPECGYTMDIDVARCPECGAEVENPVAATPTASGPVAATPSAGSRTSDIPVFGEASRNNISGSVNTNTTNTSTKHTNTNIQTSSVDNSSVVNNTTIVMEGKKTPEFCEVCGSPFEGKHARCPKCGKMICFDCKVKGKNRCVECEKKAANEYRIAFQQLLLTTNGNIGVAGRQMMNQKARDLEVEDVKVAIEKELMEEYKPTPRAEQPIVTSNATKAVNVTASTTASKGGGVGNYARTEKKGGSSSILIILVILVAVGAGAFFLLGKGDTSKEQVATEKVIEQPAAPVDVPRNTTQQAVPSTQPASKPQSAPAVTAPAPKPVQTAKPAEPKRDANYDAGMAAYNKGDGLEAISKFKASGSAEANYMLGVIYEKGCGNVAANAMMARSFYKKAANQGHGEAKAKL